MSKAAREAEFASLERRNAQDKIRTKFCQERIDQAVARLCSYCCHVRTCLLLPLTTEGKDCPYYYKAKEVKAK